MYLAPKILVLMGTPADVLPESIVYFQIYFAGSLGVVMYNIFVGILQSVGDGRHPLIYLIISSCVNVVLDIFFITGLVLLCVWCLFRVSYITLAVRLIPDIRVIFWAYPLTWSISSVIFLFLFLRGNWVHGFEKRPKKE